MRPTDGSVAVDNARLTHIATGAYVLHIEAATDADALQWLAKWLVDHDAALIQLLSAPEGSEYGGLGLGVYFQATVESAKTSPKTASGGES